MSIKNVVEGQEKIVLTGVTPSGDSMHLGNYFGAIKPLVDLAEVGSVESEKKKVVCFVSDLHALTTVQKPEVLRHNIEQVILNYLAFGVDDVKKFVFFRQSAVAAHSELAVILGNYISYGQMKRMHAFKDKLQKNADVGSINMGLFNYPILMAADILLYNADYVPVGEDQRQHVELARDIAENLNQAVGKQVLKLPEPLISKETGRILGTDGERKMSKSIGNIVSIFEDEKVIEKQIMKAYTDPTRKKATDPGHIEGNMVFLYHDLINDDKEEVADLKYRYERGLVGDVEVKRELLAAHQRFFAPFREKKADYEAHPEKVRKILQKGQEEAERIAGLTLMRVKEVLGL